MSFSLMNAEGLIEARKHSSRSFRSGIARRVLSDPVPGRESRVVGRVTRVTGHKAGVAGIIDGPVVICSPEVAGHPTIRRNVIYPDP